MFKVKKFNFRTFWKILVMVGCLVGLFTPLTANAFFPVASNPFDYYMHQQLYGEDMYPSMFMYNNPYYYDGGYYGNSYYSRNGYMYDVTHKNMYDCEIVGEDGKTFDSNIYYDSPTFDYVQTLLNNENDNIKNITNGFKPSKKFLKCHVATVPEAYKITPTELNCRVLDDKSKVLSDKSYNIAQVLNFSEQIEAENANATDSASKKKLQCVKKGMSYDVFDKKPEEKPETSQKDDTTGNSNILIPFALCVIPGVAFIVLIVVLSCSRRH